MSVQENRKKWIEALRSGEYRQTKEVLCDGDGNYCCLGVLCNMYERETGKVLPSNNSGVYNVYEDTLEELPEVMEWVGLKEVTGGFKRKDDLPDICLAGLNDECDWNFHQIADLIESEPEGLFTS